jgi:beta-mannosidase
MTRVPLHDGWSLRATAGPIPADLPEIVPATVPGTVHTDLLAAGLIPDPYIDLNENNIAWIGECDFAYHTEFSFSREDHERVDLVAEGLDTVATVRLNGIESGRTRNQHRSYRFDVRESIREGDNRLTIDFASALRSARDAQERLGARPFSHHSGPYNTVRKMACNFGWDWGPVLVTAGVWKPISLHQWSTARIVSVVPQVTVRPDGHGHVSICVKLERTAARAVLVSARLTGAGGTDVSACITTTTATGIRLDLDVADPALWWPRGYGDQPLYDLAVSVSDGETTVDGWQKSIGFRTVELRMAPDAFGTSFQFLVNGQYVWIKGANWIPNDCFLPRVTTAGYATAVKNAVDAGMNLLRIWGGGIYESDAFYELCNREGILVWQDFLFACAAYSEDAELWDEVEAEVRENVARLASNPSLACWNGSNECIEGYYHHGWREALGEGTDWGRGYYDRLLPQILAELDPTRPYIPSSPFSPADYASPRDPDTGTVHSWEVWNRRDYTTYRAEIPRFVAEFGFQGPPNYATLARSVHDDPLAPDSPGMLSHQKAHDGQGKLRRGYEPHLPTPTSFDDWHFATQLNQARAVTCGIEHFRSHSPRTAGAVVWQLNDCWPVTSWAAVDGDSRRKPLWYALRALNAPRLLMIQPRPEGLSLIASNDSAAPWREQIVVARVALDGTELAGQAVRLAVAPRTSQTVLLETGVSAAGNPAGEVVVARSMHSRSAFWYFVEDIELEIPPLALTTKVARVDHGYRVDVRADAFAKDLVLNADRLDVASEVDDQLVTLFPGESHTFIVGSDVELDREAIIAHPVLQCVNTLAHPDGHEKQRKARASTR